MPALPGFVASFPDKLQRPCFWPVGFRLAAQFLIGLGLAGSESCLFGADPGSAIKVTSLLDPAALDVALTARAARQATAVSSVSAFHTFQFADRVEATGIRFHHELVEDAGKHFRGNHYDHGNAVAAADIDGDGRPDLYFTTQLGTNRLYRNLGGGRFEDWTERAGVGLTDQISVGASFADLDNDGLPDLVVSTVRHGNHLFHNLGGGRFEDVSKAAGVDYSGHSSGVVLFDVDRDGLLDMLVCNVGRFTTDQKGPGGYFVGMTNGFTGHLFPDRTEYSILYHNEGNLKFRDITAEAGLRVVAWCGDATFADLNHDGFPELYLLNMQGDNHYMENQSGHRFVERTESTFPKTSWGGMGVKFFDFNQDGRLDLFVTDMHSDMTGLQTRISKVDFSERFEKMKSEKWCTTEYNDAYLQGAANNIFGNAFYCNLGEGRFAEVSDSVGAETFWPWGVSVGDLNADGFEDVFVPAGMGFGFRYGVNSLLLNDAGRRFADAEFALGVEPRSPAKRTHVAFTLDCSGADKDHPLARGRSGKVPFTAVASSRSAVLLDLDGDGDLDIVTNEMGDAPQVLVSDLSNRKAIHFIQVKLEGRKSNRDGLGAEVQVTAGGRTWTQFSDGKSGHLAQSSLPLYFGLGEASQIERIDVRWPSGKRQTLSTGIPSNRLLKVTEPD